MYKRQNAFRANAGTDVVSDIIFLQKRDRPADIEPDWVQLGKTEDGFAINQYFVDHPEMVLGELTTESTQYGREELTVAPLEGANLGDQLAEAVQHIEGQYTEVEVETPDITDAEAERKTLPADPDVKNFSYTVVDLSLIHICQYSAAKQPAADTDDPYGGGTGSGVKSSGYCSGRCRHFSHDLK